MDLIRRDIQEGNSYVCLNDADTVIGTFYCRYGKDAEPSYRKITEGNWLDDSPYAVIHRIAADGSEPGIGKFCLDYAYRKWGHLRIDTHGDNTVMQGLLRKEGFVHCGTIYVPQNNDPRFAYEKSEAVTKGMRQFVRKATDSDLARIAEIEVFNYRLNFYPIFRNDWFYFRELTVPSLMESYREKLDHVLVYDDGAVKGFAETEGTELRKLFVEPVLQGQAIGAALLEEAVNTCHIDHLYALEKNVRGIAFYRRHGFMETNIRKPEEDTEEYLVLMRRNPQESGSSESVLEK
jgi:ribosomal protein S18 acetylase RimI-like enzyme